MPSGGHLLILALDTATRAGSSAVLRGEELLSEVTGNAALTHGQRLPGELAQVLERAAVTLDQIDLLAVIVGPGSFTGLRVGIASMQGLAFARGLKIVPVSALEAVAAHTRRVVGDDTAIAPWIDAQRGEVFAALYGPALSAVLAAPSSASPAGTLRSWAHAMPPGPIAFAGDGAARYEDIITSTLGARTQVIPRGWGLAAEAGRTAARHPERAVLPHALVPVYVRRSDVELARDRAAGG